MVAFARSVGAALFGVDARLVDIQVSLPGGGEHGLGGARLGRRGLGSAARCEQSDR